MASSLFAGAAVVCFDGFAAYPKLSSPWELIERERVTHMGTSPRFLQAHEAGRGPFASRPAHSWGRPADGRPWAAGGAQARQADRG